MTRIRGALQSTTNISSGRYIRESVSCNMHTAPYNHSGLCMVWNLTPYVDTVLTECLTSHFLPITSQRTKTFILCTVSILRGHIDMDGGTLSRSMWGDSCFFTSRNVIISCKNGFASYPWGYRFTRRCLLLAILRQDGCSKSISKLTANVLSIWWM